MNFKSKKPETNGKSPTVNEDMIDSENETDKGDSEEENVTVDCELESDDDVDNIIHALEHVKMGSKNLNKSIKEARISISVNKKKCDKSPRPPSTDEESNGANVSDEDSKESKCSNESTDEEEDPVKVWEVENLLNKRTRRGITEYYVKWFG